ncbi:hypothetical protein N9411_00605, partial [bacterium]|nr:hypothetical protein [bacterium]
RTTSVGRSLEIELDPVVQRDGSFFKLNQSDRLIAIIEASLVEQVEETIVYRCTISSVTVAGITQVESYLISDPPNQAIAGVTRRSVIEDVPPAIRETPRVITQKLSFSSFPARGEFVFVAGGCSAWPDDDDPLCVYRGHITADFGTDPSLEIGLGREDCEEILNYPVEAFDLWVRMELVDRQPGVGEVKIEERFASALKRRRIGDLIADP